MSDNPVDMHDDAAQGVTALLARAAAEEARARDMLRIAIDDFLRPEAARLDEQARAALSQLVRSIVEVVEGELRGHGARLLTARGESTLAAALAGDEGGVYPRLAESGLLRDPELMAELLGRVRQDLLGAALPVQASDDPDRPSLINRFVQHRDRVLASSAMAVLIAESRRRASGDAMSPAQTELPDALHRRLVWAVAAALRVRHADAARGREGALDRALCDSALRSIAAHDEDDRLEAAAMRLAQAIDARAEELPDLLVEALGDRRMPLFIALVAHGLSLPYGSARDITVDASSDRLWLALRALGLGRQVIARIGYALCEADGRRDLDALADTLDAVAAVEPERARGVFDPLRLDPEYRAALAAFDCGGAR